MRATTYLRYRPGDERRTPHSRYGPIAYESPMVGEICAECGHPILAHQRVTLFAVGPDNHEAATHEAKGEIYNALAVIMHEECAWPEFEHV